MQGQNKQTRLASDRFALAHRSPDLNDPRKENQDTAGVLHGVQQFHSLPRLNMKRLGGVRQMPDRQLKQLSLRPKDRTIFKVSSYRRRIERGRHHNDAYLRPAALETLQECERKIAVQVALLEFVEDNRIDALESWIDQEPAGQNTLRDKPLSRARANPLFETDLLANRSANLFAQLPRDPSCSQACRNPARLEHDDFAGQTENGRWNTRGLPGSRRRFDDEVARLLQGRKNLRQNRIHRKCRHSTHSVDRNTAFPTRSMRLQQAIPAVAALLTSVLIIGLCQNVNFRPKSVNYYS
jgi:hypothetical protein